MPKFDDLSVLIVTWNGDDMLKNCLDSICRVYAESLEIVVVDNANLESTKKLVSGFNNAKYIPSETNLGFAGGNNLGLPLCTRKYVLLLNNDTLIHEDSFGPLIKYMEVNQKVAVTQGRMRLPLVNNLLDDSGVMMTSTGILFHQYTRLPESCTKVPSRAVHSVKGAMMMIRKSVIEELGGIMFYPHFHCNYEETDFCHRVWLRGFEVHYVDTPAIDHLMGQTIGKLNQVEVSGQSIANQFFSLATTFERWNAVRVVSVYVFLQFLLASYTLFKGHLDGLGQFFFAMKSIWRRRTELLKTRRDLQAARRISDKDLFKKIMSHPGMRYYYHFFKGSLPDYKFRKG